MGYYLTKHRATTTRCAMCLRTRVKFVEYVIPCCVECWEWIHTGNRHGIRLLEAAQRINAKLLEERKGLLSGGG